MSAAPTSRRWVVARRSDQLGGRLTAMVNATSIASANELDFRFVWPRGADLQMNDPSELFSRAYLEAYEIEVSALDGLAALPPSAGGMRVEGPPHFFEVTEPFEILRPSGEDLGIARGRFVRAFEDIGWAPPVRDVIDFVARWPEADRVSGVHVRAGDIINGGWRHLMQHDKYLPTPYVLGAIENMASEGAGKILVMSDNEPYLEWLRGRYASVVTAAQIVPGYGQLTRIQRDIADILLLSRCEVIVGPPSSSFSLLAANVGNMTVIRADGMIAAGLEADVLRERIDEQQRAAHTPPFLRSLLSRDICWGIDVFGDADSPPMQRVLATQAVHLDPEFGGAHARLARAAILSADVEAARSAAARATRIAEAIDRDPDPLVEALATSIAVECFALTLSLRGTGRFRRRRTRAQRALDDIKASLTRCSDLVPVQLDRGEVLEHSRWLVAAVEWLSHASDGMRAGVAFHLENLRLDTDVRRFRPPALVQHRSMGRFDPVARDLERMIIVLSRAIAAATSGTWAGEAHLINGYVDGSWTSRSGMQWIVGWVANPDRDGPSFVTRVTAGEPPAFAGGGPTFLFRPDVDHEPTNGRRTLSGFRFPVPLSEDGPQPYGLSPIAFALFPTGELGPSIPDLC